MLSSPTFWYLLCILQPNLAAMSIKYFVIAFCSKQFIVLIFSYYLDCWCHFRTLAVLSFNLLLAFSISSSSNQCFSSICLLWSHSCCTLTCLIPSCAQIAGILLLYSLSLEAADCRTYRLFYKIKNHETPSYLYNYLL